MNQGNNLKIVQSRNTFTFIFILIVFLCFVFLKISIDADDFIFVWPYSAFFSTIRVLNRKLINCTLCKQSIESIFPTESWMKHLNNRCRPKIIDRLVTTQKNYVTISEKPKCLFLGLVMWRRDQTKCFPKI